MRARELAWIEDDTNADERFDRNYLRRRVLPLCASAGRAAAAVARSARHAAEAQGLLDALARADLERARDGASLSVKALRALPPDRRRNALRCWIARGGHPLPDARRLEEIAGPLLEARADAHPRVEWGGGARTPRSARRVSDARMRSAALRAQRGPLLRLSAPAAAAARLGTGGTRRAARCPTVGALELEPERHAARSTSMRCRRRARRHLAARRRAPARAARRSSPCAQELAAGSSRTARRARALAVARSREGAADRRGGSWLDESMQALRRNAGIAAACVWRKPTDGAAMMC